MNHRCWPGQGRAGFSPAAHHLRVHADAPMLHHCSNSADMWGHCTGAPRRPAFTHQRLRHTRQQLLAPWSSPSPPAAAHRVAPVSSTGCTSRGNLASSPRPHLSCQAGLRRPQQRLSRRAGLLHRTRLSRQSGLPPSVAPLYAKPTSDPPPIAAAPARCGRLPRPRLAIRDHHASHRRTSTCCRR